MKYYAKSNPKETIQQHTDNILKEYERLKEIYPHININWDILKYICIYHDLGKMNKIFQNKIGNEDVKLTKEEREKVEIPHAILSAAFINVKELKEKNISKDDIKIIVNAIAKHHDREFDIKENNNYIIEEIEKLKEISKDFTYKNKTDYCKDVNTKSIRRINASGFQKKDNQENYYKYIMLKGILNKLDYVASAYEEVEIKNDFLIQSLNKMVENLWKKENKNANYNELQKYALKNQNENLIIIAQTGMGKTEAGLLWIGDNKGFFTLPLKTAINSIYDRITKDIVKEKISKRIGLLHSDAVGEILNRQEREGKEKLDLDEMPIYQYNSKTKLLSMPLTISTIDQIFDFVFKYNGSEMKLATLSYSKTVIDEIQMYSADLVAYLIVGLRDIVNLGGKFAIITATFPPFIEELLENEKIDFKKPESFLKEDMTRHKISIKKEQINAKFICERYKENKVLVIVNTVKQAQNLYKTLKQEYDIDSKNINLFHSGFIKKDRKEKEENIIKFGNKNNKEKGIWICTQVAEASLDIDFDILITELSDINGLFQRMGRCYRNRKYDKEEANCYIFDGGDEKTSGIGYVIDKDIFEFSKEELRKIGDIKLSENKKIEIINNIYTMEKLKDTEYLNEIQEKITYLDDLRRGEKTKKEVKDEFRNINSISVIPKSVYEENIEILKQAEEKLKDKSIKMSDDKEKMKVERLKAKNMINEHSISIPYHKLDNEKAVYKKLNRYEEIIIFDCKYNSDTGIDYIKTDKKNNIFI